MPSPPWGQLAMGPYGCIGVEGQGLQARGRSPVGISPRRLFFARARPLQEICACTSAPRRPNLWPQRLKFDPGADDISLVPSRLLENPCADALALPPQF